MRHLLRGLNLENKEHHSPVRASLSARLTRCYFVLYLKHNEGTHFHLYCHLMLTVVGCVAKSRSTLTQQTSPWLG